MLDHLALQSDDVDAAVAFYTRVFAALGVREEMLAPRPKGSCSGCPAQTAFPASGSDHWSTQAYDLCTWL